MSTFGSPTGSLFREAASQPSDGAGAGLGATAAESGAPTMALDLAQLELLKSLDPAGGDLFVNRVLTTYLGSLERQLIAVNVAREQGNTPEIGRAAHTLKAASASVGAMVFSEACKDLETRIRGGQVDKLEPLLDHFLMEAARVRDAIRFTLGTSAS